MADLRLRLVEDLNSSKTTTDGTQIGMTGKCTDGTAIGSEIGDINPAGLCAITGSDYSLSIKLNIKGLDADFLDKSGTNLVKDAFAVPSCPSLNPNVTLSKNENDKINVVINSVLLKKCVKSDPKYLVTFRSKTKSVTSYTSQTYDPKIKHEPPAMNALVTDLLIVTAAVLVLGAIGFAGFHFGNRPGPPGSG